MATAKIITWSRPNKDGQYPIGIKIYNNGKTSYIFEGHTVPSRDAWNAKKQEVRKAVPNAARLTNYLTKKLTEVRDQALEMDTNKENPSPQRIKKVFQNEFENTEAGRKRLMFADIAGQYLQDALDSGDLDVYRSEKSRIKRFLEFSDGGQIPFSEITVEYLRRYVIFLKKDKNRNGNENTPRKPLSNRTIMNHLLGVRTLWNRAITAKMASRDDYPFGAGKISIKFPESPKIGPDFDELEKLEKIELTKRRLHHARNICLVSYYFAGMRITDTLLMKWTDFQNGRFHYTMSKNGEPGSLKIPEKAMAIINQYKDDKAAHDLVFPDLKRLESLLDRTSLRRAVNSSEGRINKAIKEVMGMIGSTKNTSPHKFRHAFAQRAEEKDVHPKVLQKLYRHESILTTMKYQSNFSHRKADEALDAVLGL